MYTMLYCLDKLKLMLQSDLEISRVFCQNQETWQLCEYFGFEIDFLQMCVIVYLQKFVSINALVMSSKLK